MTNDDMHRRFLDFGRRHGLLQGERLRWDIGMLDEKSILMILELAYMAGMQEGAQTIRDLVRDYKR